MRYDNRIMMNCDTTNYDASRVRDLHPTEARHAGRTKKKSRDFARDVCKHLLIISKR